MMTKTQSDKGIQSLAEPQFTHTKKNSTYVLAVIATERLMHFLFWQKLSWPQHLVNAHQLYKWSLSSACLHLLSPPEEE